MVLACSWTLRLLGRIRTWRQRGTRVSVSNRTGYWRRSIGAFALRLKVRGRRRAQGTLSTMLRLARA